MIDLTVCIGSACYIRGAYNIVQEIQQLMEEQALHDKINFNLSFCMKQCQNKGVSVMLGEKYFSLRPDDVKLFWEKEVLTLVH